jgi:hypothetical protein
MSIVKRLESYTEVHPEEVLIVTATDQGEEDIILIFKGFSSSLLRPTAVDPDVPVLSETAVIQTIDRVASPYNPDNPRYIAQGLSWADMEPLV